MGDLIRYPGHENREGRRPHLRFTADLYLDPLPDRQNRYVVAGHRWLVNMNSLAKYFNEGDPVPQGKMKLWAVSAGS